MTHSPDPGMTDASAGEAVGAPPFLSLHTVVVLLTALDLGLVVGGLAALTGAAPAAAVLAGLTAAGASTPALRSLIR